MAAAQLPLHRQVVASKTVKNIQIYRTLAFCRFLLYAIFFTYRFLHRPDDGFGLWLAAVICEMALALYWLIAQSLKWFPVERETFPERVASRHKKEGEPCTLPAVDVFVTTADPFKEPPLITMNTVLSALAIDYPVDKIACYVSDDGASYHTFWALVETSRFAKKWIPFCKKFRIEPRAPKAYFKRASRKFELHSSHGADFGEAFRVIKIEYEEYKRQLDRIMTAKDAAPQEIFAMLDGQKQWPGGDPCNHPGIFKVLLDHKANRDEAQYPLPYLVYVSREKQPHYKHHFKAGAMKTLVRVSGVMTNSPFILNLDCDMYVNSSKALLHAMCFLTDPSFEKEVCFVQFPQCFDGVDDEDIYANNLKSGYDIVLKCMDGVQGPPYCGTGCVHRRSALYRGPEDLDSYNLDSKLKGAHDEKSLRLSYEHVKSRFGRSAAFASSVGSTYGSIPAATFTCGQDVKITDVLDVSSCNYEENTEWGDEIGWIYGSNTEDILTGMKEHGRGWRSVYCRPEEPAFVGYAPTNGPDVLTWRKRVSIGVMEMLVGKHSPFLFSKSKGVTSLQRIIYICFGIWPFLSVFVFTYAALQAVCLIRGQSLVPKISDPYVVLFILLFLSLYYNSFIENRWIDVGTMAWWNSERMRVITGTSSDLLGLMEVVLKVMGVSETVFTVTPKKEQEEEGEVEAHGSAPGKKVSSFCFNESPLFVTPTALVILNAGGLAVGMARVAIAEVGRSSGGGGSRMEELGGQLFCSLWVIFNLYPFWEGLWKKGAHGIPKATLLKASALALLLCLLSNATSAIF